MPARHTREPSVDTILRDMNDIIERLDRAGLYAPASRMAMAIDAYHEALRPPHLKWRKVNDIRPDFG